MAAPETRSPEQIRAEIAVERERLARSVESLRGGTDVQAKLRSKLPAVALGALGAGFVLGGGIGATVESILRRL